jgi:hypothetical protein
VHRCRARTNEIGAFRERGEIHQWMYDRYSLARLLVNAGFCDPRLETAVSSAIPRWDNYCLDARPDGTPIKPDCFYMEAQKGVR